jgi:hypothetical protein
MTCPDHYSLVVRRRAAVVYRRLLIAADPDDAFMALPLLSKSDAKARIAVLGTYRVGFCGLRTLFGLPRLERELAARTQESLLAFVDSTGMDTSRFELLARHGDLDDHVVREARSRQSDLVVLAPGRCRCRAQQVVTRLLEETRCDLVIARREGVDSGTVGQADLVAVGPWPC